MKRIRFGTDGWRALIAEDYTFENVRYVASGIGQYLQDTNQAPKGVVVGYDTRFGSPEFARAVAEMLASQGITVSLTDRACPTPVVSWAVLERGAGGGVVVTSSHNPGTWNGIKYKPDYGGSATPEIVAALEERIDAFQDRGPAAHRRFDELVGDGLIQLFDPRPGYLAQVRRLVDTQAIKDAGLRIAIDPMYGAGAGYFHALLDGGATKVVEIHGHRNPAFPGMHAPEPIARNLEELMALVPREGLQVGLALDGDADRLGVVDEHGAFVTQLQVFGLLVMAMLEVRGERGPIVRSLTTTVMADKLAKRYGVPVFETKVGFKYIGPVMMEEKAIIGGEESGGYGFAGHLPERDGVVAGLYFVQLMMALKKTPAELIDYLYGQVGPHYYDRIDVEFPPDQREAILARVAGAQPAEVAGIPVTGVRTDDGFRFALGEQGWLLVRFSGTEPLLRIYTEIDSPERVEQVLAAGKALAGV